MTIKFYIRCFFQDFDQPPASAVTYLGEYTTFQCSIGGGRIFWYVNNTYVLGLPLEYEASFMTEPTNDYINSTLRLRAIERANNSQILCAVRINGRDNQTYFPLAILQIQGNTYQCIEKIRKPEDEASETPLIDYPS